MRPRRLPRSPPRCSSRAPWETSPGPASPVLPCSERLPPLALDLRPLSSPFFLGLWVQLLLFLLRRGHPDPASPPGRAGMRRFSEDSATQLPARRWRGRVAGLGRAGRSGRPSWASPWLGQAGFPGWSGGILGKAGAVPAGPAFGNPRSPVAPGGSLSRAAAPAPPGAQNSWGSQRVPKRMGAGNSLRSWDAKGHDRGRFCFGSGKSP